MIRKLLVFLGVLELLVPRAGCCGSRADRPRQPGRSRTARVDAPDSSARSTGLAAARGPWRSSRACSQTAGDRLWTGRAVSPTVRRCRRATGLRRSWSLRVEALGRPRDTRDGGRVRPAGAPRTKERRI